MTEVIEEFVAEAFTFMGAWDETCDVEEFDGDRAAAGNAGAIVGFAAIGEVVACTGTINLEVADCALRIYRCKPSMENCSGLVPSGESHVERFGLRKIACAQISAASSWSRWAWSRTDPLWNLRLLGYCDGEFRGKTLRQGNVPVEGGRFAR
jgi:hypothetical protein